MDDTVWIGLFFAAFGTLFETVGLFMIIKTQKFIAGSQKVAAEVISVSEDHEVDDEGHASTTYRPTVRFQTLDGVEHTAETFFSASNYDYDVGARITVLYKPGEENVRIPGGFNQYFLPGMFVGMGTLFILIGMAIAVL